MAEAEKESFDVSPIVLHLQEGELLRESRVLSELGWPWGSSSSCGSRFHWGL